MSLFSHGCYADIMLTDRQRTQLKRLSYGDQEPARLLGCELETGHSGEHYALSHTTRALPLWLRWNDIGTVTIVPRPFCEAQRHHDGQVGRCTRPVDHDGACDFGR